jgi:hypothetical protein
MEYSEKYSDAGPSSVPAAAQTQTQTSATPDPYTAPYQTAAAKKRLSASRYLNLKRLPTLQEVLDRRTRAPLDLFCFYVSSWSRLVLPTMRAAVHRASRHQRLVLC